jgi:hypothetical protein
MKKILFILCCLLLLNSCKDKLNNQITTKPFEYWVEDDEYYQNTYACYAYQFYENGKYKRFVIRRNKKQIHPYSGGDVYYPDDNWKLFNDSMKIGSNNFKLNIINDSVILLRTKNYEEKLLKKAYKEDYIKMKNSLN